MLPVDLKSLICFAPQKRPLSRLLAQVVTELPPAPEALQVLWDLPTRKTKMPNDLKKV